MSASASPSAFGSSAIVLLGGPSTRIVLHRKLILTCFMIPICLGLLAGLLIPDRGTADALLLVTESTAAAGVSDQAWVPWDTAAFVAGVLKPLRVYPTDDPAVVRVVATADTPQSAMTVMSRILDTVGSAHFPAKFSRLAVAGGPDVAADQPKAGKADLAEDLRQTSRRIADLTERFDALQQQAEGARAVSAAASQLLAGQPATLPDSWQTEPNTPSDAERALLLSLMVEREHLVSQYAADFPAIQEVNRKIATVQATIAGDGKPRRVTTRDVRNPTAIALTTRLALSRLAELDATAQSRVIQNQLAEARAQSADLAHSRDEAPRSGQAASASLEPMTTGPDLAVLRAPAAGSGGWTLVNELLLASIAAGLALAGAAAVFQRWAVRFLFPVDGIRLWGEHPLAAVPHLVDSMEGVAGPMLVRDTNPAGVLLR